jgi:hypothetical protein
MPLGLIVPPGRPPLSQVPVALDEPAIVVAVDEASHGLAEILDGVAQLDPGGCRLFGHAILSKSGLALT